MKFYPIKSIVGKKISFDFDGTLSDDFDGTFNRQKNEIKNICSQLIKLGNDVCIITKRFSPKYKEEGLINEHLEVYAMAEELGIPSNKVYFTNREMKVEHLEKLKIDIHFENSEIEISIIESSLSNITIIHVEDPYWRDMIY